jgi:FkbM family methyltransferase
MEISQPICEELSHLTGLGFQYNELATKLIGKKMNDLEYSAESETLNSLEKAISRRRILSKCSTLERFILSPRMLAITAFCKILHSVKRTKVVHTQTFWGQKLDVTLPEAVSSEILRFGYIEEAVARAFISNIEPGDTVLDVGGHLGLFSLLAAHLVGSTGQVHTFEPTPTTFELLSKNCDYPNLSLNNAAAWFEETTLQFNDYGPRLSAFSSIRSARLPAGETASKAIVHVPAVRLDDYCKDNNLAPSFVKIDAESAEREVLSGMHNTIQQHRPVICLEVGDLGVQNAAKSKDLVKLIIKYGYNSLELENGLFKEHEIQEKYEYKNLVFVPK